MMTDRAGSSPLSRGIRFVYGLSADRAGIIPALAGNTTSIVSRTVNSSDHPRSRGEYVRSYDIQRIPPGSSPLSRGILRYHAHPDPRTGIIPALAGNTKPAASSHMIPTDHPRSRGEYIASSVSAAAAAGSSPLSRGIQHGVAKLVPPLRIIPALAGNTSQRLISMLERKDHPRSRGEYRRGGQVNY